MEKVKKVKLSLFNTNDRIDHVFSTSAVMRHWTKHFQSQWTKVVTLYHSGFKSQRTKLPCWCIGAPITQRNHRSHLIYINFSSNEWCARLFELISRIFLRRSAPCTPECFHAKLSDGINQMTFFIYRYKWTKKWKPQ